jgi:hypothetical protein
LIGDRPASSQVIVSKNHQAPPTLHGPPQGANYAGKAWTPEVLPKKSTVPLFDAYGIFIGRIPLEKALRLHGQDLTLRARGTGKRRHFTSAKLYARVSQVWAPRSSSGFVVLQLITE